MRSLTIDDDILAAARELAKLHKTTIGTVISSLARQALHPLQPARFVRNGIRLLPIQSGAGVTTLETIREIEEELLREEILVSQLP